MAEAKDRGFMLSRVIPAHTNDVKCVFATSVGSIISGSRDGTVKIFSERAGDYMESLLIRQSNKLAVNSVTFYQNSSGWYIFAGRMDGSIAIFSSGRAEPIRVLTQHSNNVCTLYIDSKNVVLLSGSWDNTAIVWPLEEVIGNNDFNALALVGHKMAVWAAVSIPEKPNFYLTGSADLTIKYWNGDTVLNTFSGHEDVVRCVAVVSTNIFISASNDFTVRVWNLDSTQCMQKYNSLACEFIFSMTLMNQQSSEQMMLANCGESGFIEICSIDCKSQIAHKQFIRTPAQSAWSIAVVSNGDIAVAADDGNIYVFTKDERRKAHKEQLAAFEENLAMKIAKAEALLASQQQEVVKIKISLGEGEPDMELRYKKGSDPMDAAETFVKENSIPISYVDEICEYIKTNIPEARMATKKKMAQMTANQRVLVDGQVWDYVFDVATEDGRTLQLPYNVGEDTNWAARRFVEKNNLPNQFVDKVSTLLHLQVPELSASASSKPGFVDPFTGTGRYVPGMNSSSSNQMDSVSDPFIGGSRYIPAAQNGTVSAMDTGDGRVSSFIRTENYPRDKKHPRGELVPMNQFFKFSFEKLSSKAVAKLKEMNELQSTYRLSDKQLSALEAVLSNSPFSSNNDLISAIDAGLSWNNDTIVPILDVLRLALLNEQFNEVYCSINETNPNESHAIKTLQKYNTLLSCSKSDPIFILVCRGIANAAVHEYGRKMLASGLNSILNPLLALLSNCKPAVQLACVSAIANCSLLLLANSLSNASSAKNDRETMINALIKSLKANDIIGEYNDATKIRLLQAIVTLMWGSDSVVRVAKECDVIALVSRLKDAVSDENGKAIARDIIVMTYAL